MLIFGLSSYCLKRMAIWDERVCIEIGLWKTRLVKPHAYCFNVTVDRINLAVTTFIFENNPTGFIWIDKRRPWRLTFRSVFSREMSHNGGSCRSAASWTATLIEQGSIFKLVIYFRVNIVDKVKKRERYFWMDVDDKSNSILFRWSKNQEDDLSFKQWRQ